MQEVVEAGGAKWTYKTSEGVETTTNFKYYTTPFYNLQPALQIPSSGGRP